MLGVQEGEGLGSSQRKKGVEGGTLLQGDVGRGRERERERERETGLSMGQGFGRGEMELRGIDDGRSDGLLLLAGRRG